jgi:hypothetical protein
MDHEERITGGLLVHQLRQLGRALRFAAKRICNELAHIVGAKGRQAHLMHNCANLADGIEFACQRMSGINLIGPIGTDQKQVLQLRLSQQILEQVEGRRVEPLQVVEEQRQRMLRPGKDTNETPKHQLEAPLRILRWKLDNRGLIADNELQLRDDVDHELAVRT